MDEYIVINQSNNKCYNVNELVFDVLMYSTEIKTISWKRNMDLMTFKSKTY